MRLRAVLLPLLFAALPAGLSAQAPDSLERMLQQRIAGSGATVGVYYLNLRSGDSVTIGADRVFHAASTMKVAVMIQVFRDADSGRISLDQRIAPINRFRSLVGDSMFSLDSTDDSERELYRRRPTDSVKVKDLVELMITKSSNFATDLLIDRVGADRVQATLHQLGIDSLRVLRGVEDDAAYRAGLNNTTTARALGQLFLVIAEGMAASPRSCAAMMDILAHQRFNQAIPAGLPPHTKVAHKTGDLTNLMHDGGIVYKDNRAAYLLVVLTRGKPIDQAATLIADLSRIVWNYLVPPPPPKPKMRDYPHDG